MVIGTFPKPRATIAKAVRDRIAGDFEAQHAEIWRAGERWFSEQDAIWRVHADTAMFIGGIRALLLQARCLMPSAPSRPYERSIAE